MTSLVAEKSKNSNINLYALAVGSGLGLVSGADAEIIYTDVPDLIASDWGNGGESFSIDLNNDGLNDFTFSHVFSPQGYSGYYGPYGYYGYPIQHWGYSKVQGTNPTPFPFPINNFVIGAMDGPLAAGTTIGQNQTFSNQQYLGQVYYYDEYGPWPTGTRAYVGLQFMAGFDVHYGWAQIEVGGYSGDVRLFDYAYESEAFKSITAGAMPSPVPLPGMAPLLGAALGALGVGSFRRRRREAQAGNIQ